MIIRYESTAALRQAYIDNRCKYQSGSGLDWFGGESQAVTLDMAEVGNTHLVPKAEAALDKLENTLETPRKVWERSVAGPFCSVPDVLANLPTPMRRQVHVRDETSPITILAVTTSSGGIPAETLARRGTVILALVIALSRVRPVTLQQLTVVDGRRDGTGETIITSEINTHPLDLATACYVLTSAGFARRLTYGLAQTLNGFTGGWPSGFSYSSPKAYYDRLIPRLVADPSRCLLIEAARLNDRLLSHPTEWLNDQIAKFTQNQEEEVY